MSPSTSRFIILCLGIAALGLAGCANTGGTSGLFGEAATRPKTIFVADFVASPEVEAIDRGFSARMDRKGINYPILERKRRTLARVDDEIVASIVATLREAGLEAQPGSEEGLTLNDEAAVVSGRLRAGDQGSAAKNKQIGFGTGRGGVVADMTVSYFSGGGKKQLLAFDADAKPPASRWPVNRRRRATRRSPRFWRRQRPRRRSCRRTWKRRRAGSAARWARRSWPMPRSRAGWRRRRLPRRNRKSR